MSHVIDAGQSLPSTSLATGVTRLLTRRQPSEVSTLSGQTSPYRDMTVIKEAFGIAYIL
jgi:hypothetical protein